MKKLSNPLSLFEKVGIYLLFFSLPIIAALKGKGTVLWIAIIFALYGWQVFWKHLRGFSLSYLRLMHISKDLIKSPYFWGLSFSIWGLLSVFWSPAPRDSLKDLNRLLLFLGGCYYAYQGIKHLPIDHKKFMGKKFVHAFSLYIVLYLLEIYGGQWISFYYTQTPGFYAMQFLRGTVILVFLYWPYLMGLRYFYPKKRFILYALLSTLGIILILFQARPDAVRLGLGIGMILLVLTFYKQIFAKLFLGLLIVYGIISPFLSLNFLNDTFLHSYMHYLPTSYQHRIQIWYEMSLKIIDSLWIGYGFDFASFLKGGKNLCLYFNKQLYHSSYYRAITLPQGDTPYAWGGKLCTTDTIFSSHSHNGFVQIWLEMGFVGIIICLGLLWSVMRPYYQRFQKDSFINAIAWAMVGTYSVIWSLSFGIWQKWLIGLVAFMIILYSLFKTLLGRPLYNSEIQDDL